MRSWFDEGVDCCFAINFSILSVFIFVCRLVSIINVSKFIVILLSYTLLLQNKVGYNFFSVLIKRIFIEARDDPLSSAALSSSSSLGLTDSSDTSSSASWSSSSSLLSETSALSSMSDRACCGDGAKTGGDRATGFEGSWDGGVKAW